VLKVIYFTADTHFYHSNIINLSSRPFRDVHHMNRQLIQNWNAYVTDIDEIYILGDFMYKGTAEDANSLLKKLKGKKYLIRGNHDKYLNHEGFNSSLFEWVADYYVLNYKKRKFVLFHYPILEWAGYFRDDIHLYGHVHNSNKDPAQKSRLDILGNKAINVGVDVNNYFPISIEKVISMVDGNG
jgi:calcineurin-like phosphoesterase family protein